MIFYKKQRGFFYLSLIVLLLGCGRYPSASYIPAREQAIYQQKSPQEELLKKYAELDQESDQAAQIFPSSIFEGTDYAIDTANQRILDSFSNHRLTFEEAQLAQRILDESLDALVDLQRKRSQIRIIEQNQKSGFVRYEIHGMDSNVIINLLVRPKQTDGEARIGLETTVVDGEKLSKGNQMLLRLDHQKFDGEVAFDVQFTGFSWWTKDTLDRKVHGVFYNDNGVAIPDHHFKH